MKLYNIVMNEREVFIMEKLYDLVAACMAATSYFSAVAGAGAASVMHIYQPKTPKALLK